MSHSRALVCAFVAFFAWVQVDVLIKYFCQGPDALSPFVILASLGLFGASALFGMTAIKRKTHVLRPTDIRGQVCIALCNFGVNYANIIALKHLPLTMFYIIVFTAPFFIAAFSAYLKHERMTPIKIACLVAGFVGVAFAVGIRGGGNTIGYVACFIGVILFAIDTILIRNISRTDTAESTQFFTAVFVGVVGAALAFFEETGFPVGWAIVGMILAGSINTLGNVLFNVSLKFTTSTNVAQLHYTQIITGAIFGYLIWNEIPTWNLLVGSVFIIVSGLVVVAHARKGEIPPIGSMREL